MLEAFPSHSVLVFCDSKKRCENVANLLVNVIQLDPDTVERVVEVKKEEKELMLDFMQVEIDASSSFKEWNIAISEYLDRNCY